MTNSSIVTIKGQIVIPVQIRKKVGIKKGTRVVLEEKDGDIIVHPVNASFYDRMCGVLKGKGLLKEFLSDKKKEKEREDARFGKG